ncbi:hypothetical protein PS15p_203508 [Mucor circinelloides]
MKRVLADYCLNCEKSIYLLQAFAVLTKLTFKWFEKQNDESSGDVYPNTNYHGSNNRIDFKILAVQRR